MKSTITVLLISLIASIPAFAFLASTPKPVVVAAPAVRSTVVLPDVHVGVDPVVVVPETKVVVYKARKYASLIDSKQPPCGAGFWASKQACKLGR